MRKKAIFGAIRKHLGRVLHELVEQKGCRIVEGHLQLDHVHMCISTPPKHSVSYDFEPATAKLSFISIVNVKETTRKTSARLTTEGLPIFCADESGDGGDIDPAK
jgi:REP element-mobilizing transposase RayT